MVSKQVHGRGFGFKGWAAQVHIGLFWRATTFLAVACGASGYHVVPFVAAARVARFDVVNRQLGGFAPTVLAGVIIPPEYFPLGQIDTRPWAFNHIAEANNGGDFKLVVAGANGPTAVHNQFGLARQKQTQRTLDVADVQRFKINIQNEDRCSE